MKKTIVIIIILILLALYLSSKSDVKTSNNTNDNNVESLIITAKKYYDEESPLAGTYTMTPILAIKVEDLIYDIKYRYKKISSGDEGIDNRRFEFFDNTLTTVVSLGGTASGKTVFNIEDDDFSPHILRY